MNKPTANTRTSRRSQLVALCVIVLFLIQLLRSNNNRAPIRDAVMLKPKNDAPRAIHFPLIAFEKQPQQDPINLLEHNGTFVEKNCQFYKHGSTPFGCKIEWDEWMLVNAFVRPVDVVIEFGARYGTTTCVLSRAVGHDGIVVAVEPDSNVHASLLQNNFHNQCGAQLVLGTVGDTTMYIPSSATASNYGTQTDTTPGNGMEPVPKISLPALEAALGKRINVALIDCEGCIRALEPVLDAVDMILMEEDMIDYTPWHRTLFEKNFDCIWYTKDTAAPNKRWSQELRHSAWIRKGVKRDFNPSCADYVVKAGLDPTNQLVCAECPKPVL